MGPTASKPGPILLKHASTAEKVVPMLCPSTYDAENNTVNKTQGYFDNLPITFNLPSSVQSYKFGFLGSQDVISNIRLSNIMLNKGTEALPYEPAGQSKLDLDPYLPEFSDYLTDSLLIAVPGALGLTGVIAGIRIGLRKFRSVV